MVISQGGTVERHLNAGMHGLAIYEPGIGAEDIDVHNTIASVGLCSPPLLLDDPNGRIAVFDQSCGLGLQPDGVSFAFDEPGRYLFIYTFSPHFVDFDMFSWVIVEPGK